MCQQSLRRRERATPPEGGIVVTPWSQEIADGLYAAELDGMTGALNARSGNSTVSAYIAYYRLADSKSAAFTGVWVQIPPRAPTLTSDNKRSVYGARSLVIPAVRANLAAHHNPTWIGSSVNGDVTNNTRAAAAIPDPTSSRRMSVVA